MRVSYRRSVFSSLVPNKGFIMAHAYGIAITREMLDAWSRANSLKIVQMEPTEFDRAIRRGRVDYGWSR